MTRLASRFFTLPAVLFLLLTISVAAQERRVALVIGNSAYAEAVALPNTVNDATAVAQSLERLGFTVFASYDATQAELLATVGDFSKALKGADAAVLFYAGHGVQIGSENYILPVDIHVENELSVKYGALALTDLLRSIETQARVAVVILDACRDNPFAAQLAAADPTRSLAPTRGLARVSPSGNGAIIAYAAASGEVASDGDGVHSPFTAALLGEMEKPGVEVGLLFRRVAGRVIEATGGTQRPEVLVRLASEYYLAELPPAEIVLAATPAPVTPMAAPVNVQPITPIVIAQGPSSSDVTARDTARQAAAAADQPDAADRAALWGYMAALTETPFDVPVIQWVAPERESIAEAEPNNSFGAAQPVNPNDELSLSIGTAGDHDWFRVTVQQGGTLTIQAPTPPADVAPAVRLLNATGEELVFWVIAPRAGGELFAEFDLAKPGTYWLQFAGGTASELSTERFAVALSYAVSPDGFEPNDRIDLARHVPLDGTFPISILPRADRDWFEFTTDAPGALLVSLTGVPEAIEGNFRLLNADGVEIVYWVAAPRPGGDTVAVLDLPEPGVYYLEIAGGENDQRSVEPLTLTTRFAKSPDLYEPNANIAEAMPVNVESEHTMAIFPARDDDFLALDIVQPGELTVAIESPPENLSLGFRVIDGNGNEAQYWTLSPRAGGDLFGTFDAARPGRYYLQFTDYNGASAIDPFTLNLDFTASLDAFEPNDTIGTASILTAGGEVPFTMFPKADADWFRVTVAEPGELSVMIDEGPENLDITYRVINTDWNELVYWTPAFRKGGLTEGFADLPRPGTYYLEVRDGNNDDRSIEPATMITAFTATTGSNEPNNVVGEATPVDLEGSTAAHILPLNDADWHVFYAPGPGALDVTIDEVPENLDISFRVLNADYAEIQYWIAAPRPGGDTTGTVTIPAAGWYWMEIRDGNNNERSPMPFRVTRAFRPS